MGVCLEDLSFLLGDTELLAGLEFGRFWHVVSEVFVIGLGSQAIVLEAAFEFHREGLSHLVFDAPFKACLFFVIPSYLKIKIRPG